MKAKDINAVIAKTPPTVVFVAEFVLTKSYIKNRRGGVSEYGFPKGCLVRATAYEGMYRTGNVRTGFNDGLFQLPASVLKFTRYVQVQ